MVTSTKAQAVDLEALDVAHMFHPNTNLAALHAGGPLVLARGEGAYVWDTHGKRYIEGMAGRRVRADQEALVHAPVRGQEP